MTSIFQLHNFIAIAGVWTLGNGILHDVFVLRERRPFERDLIRLLIDGHILIFSGIAYLLCYKSISERESLAFHISITISIFLLGYCALIFKMLPSFGTILVNSIALVWLIASCPGLLSSNNSHSTSMNNPSIIRISIGHFQPAQSEEVAKMLTESEIILRPAIEKLDGNLAYYAGIDKEKSTMTNSSIWRTRNK